jgi:hypothetical protein
MQATSLIDLVHLTIFVFPSQSLFSLVTIAILILSSLQAMPISTIFTLVQVSFSVTIIAFSPITI